MEKTRMKPDERLALMGLNALYESFDKYIEPLIPRMKHDPHAHRMLKAGKTAVRRAIYAVCDTVEHENLSYIVKNSKHYEIIVRQRQITKDPVWMYVKTTDLEKVLEHAVHDECSLCMKAGGEAGKCPLRKALINMVDEPAADYGCGFRGGKLRRKE